MIIIIEYLALVDGKLVKMKHSCKGMSVKDCVRIAKKDKNRITKDFILTYIDNEEIPNYRQITQYKGKITAFGYELE